MKTTVYLNEFRDYFNQIRPNNFSYEGLGILFDYLEEYEESTGEELELDVIAICCDFSEEDFTDIAKGYDIELDEEADEEDQMQTVADYLTDEGVYIGQTGTSIIYRVF
jgi:hypothetical protein